MALRKPEGKPVLGPLEAELMDLVWKAERPVAVRELHEKLNHGRQPELAYTTVMTVMARLAEKGVLRRHREGRGYVYGAARADSGPGALVTGAHWVATLFVSIVAAGVLLGFRSIVDQVRASRVLARRVRALELPLSRELEGAVERAGLRGRVLLVDSPECFSF